MNKRRKIAFFIKIKYRWQVTWSSLTTPMIAIKNGRRDDKLTHVAIVESVNDSGTISIIHLGSRGISRIFMNLYEPDVYKDGDGNIMNLFYVLLQRTKVLD